MRRQRDPNDAATLVLGLGIISISAYCIYWFLTQYA